MFNIWDSLLRGFEEEDIRYLHWKGNNHFLDGFEGRGDVDILVHEDDYDNAVQIMNRVGFKRFLTQPFLKNPYMEDWLALDEDTGTMVHFHLHKEMVFGLTYVNEYVFVPYEECFSSRVCEESVYIQNPVWEYILLLCRVYTKSVVAQNKINNNLTYLRNCLGTSPDFSLCNEYDVKPGTIDFLSKVFNCEELSYSTLKESGGVF